LRGDSLAGILRQRGRLPLVEVAELVRDVCAGLADAWRQGVVHRDLKPGNIIRADQSAGRPVWKILDFGVSKVGDHDGTLTEGKAIGTPPYMAPEQARGETVDHRADIHAIAANAYRSLTGQPAFAGQDSATVMYAVVHRLPPRPSEIVTLPREVDDVLTVGLAKRPEHRFARSEELAAAFTAAALGDISDELRARARRCNAAHPWGADR
jgi:serine/threonine-protein kinase